MIYFIILGLIQAKIQPDVNLTLGLDITDSSSLEFVTQFQPYFLEFREKGLQMQIMHHLLPCYSCEARHNFTMPEKNCYGGGRYCQFADSVAGQTLLKEIIRQSCILEEQPVLYFNYSTYFMKECSHKPSSFIQCSSRYFQNFNVSTKEIDKCIENSFEGEQKDQQLKTNRILAYHKEQQYNHSTFTLYLNNENQTNTKIEELLNVLCKKFEFNLPSFCAYVKKVDQIEKGNVLETLFLFIFAILILILITSTGWSLLKKVQFSSFFNPKSKIAIPREEKDHIIQEDDL